MATDQWTTVTSSTLQHISMPDNIVCLWASSAFGSQDRGRWETAGASLKKCEAHKSS